MSDIPADALRETWESVYEKSVKLAQLIEAHCRETSERFDVMVVVPRGGYYPANIVSRELGFGATDLLHACIGSYVGQGTTDRTGEFKLGQMPAPESVRDKNVLVIEEVCDTGQTLAYLDTYLKDAGASLVRTGALHYKPGQSQTGFQPDWAVEETERWIVYPWEQHELNGKQSAARRAVS